MKPEKMPAYMDCQRIVHLVCKLYILLLKYHMRRNHLAEVIKNQTGKDFLLDILHFFCMETTQANCIFQLPESCFDSPTHRIEFFS